MSQDSPSAGRSLSTLWKICANRGGCYGENHICLILCCDVKIYRDIVNFLEKKTNSETVYGYGWKKLHENVCLILLITSRYFTTSSIAIRSPAHCTRSIA